MPGCIAATNTYYHRGAPQNHRRSRPLKRARSGRSGRSAVVAAATREQADAEHCHFKGRLVTLA
ncbi:MAG TPA: hypothetical protein VGL17_13915 [Gemmatimonadaceae bacterium]